MRGRGGPASASLRRPGRSALAAVLVAGLLGCDAPEPVVVGASSSLSQLTAARLAFRDLTADAPVPLDTVFVPDGGGQAPATLDAVAQLLSSGVVAVVGHSGSSASLAAAPVYNDHGIVQIAPTSTADDYTAAGPFSFRMVPPNRRQGEFLAEVVRRELPEGARVAVTYVNDDYGRGLRRSFLTALRTGSGAPTVVLDLPHLDNLWMTRDSARYIEDAVIAVDPDALVWLGRPNSLGTVLVDLRAAVGEDLMVVGGDALETARREAHWPTEGEPVRYAGFIALDSVPEARQWADRHTEDFGYRPTPDAALAYDAMGVIVAAVGAGARTGEEVRAYLMELGRTRPPYPGITGPVTFDTDGDREGDYSLFTLGWRANR